MSVSYPIFVKRDLDGFFGLAIDNLVQLLAIVTLCGTFCGMSGANNYFIFQNILPGIAVSLVIGNVFYAAQAHWVARRERRSDVTALPYGLNTPSLLVYIFFVMMPAYDGRIRAGDPTSAAAKYAWQLGLMACLGSGIIEFAGAFVAERLRRNTPRAALLGTLAGIAIAFISMVFVLQIWQRPLVSMVPLAIVLLLFFSKVRFPLGLPGGLVAVLAGTALAWLLTTVQGSLPWDVTLTTVQVGPEFVRQAWTDAGRFLPIWSGADLWQTWQHHHAEVIPLLSVIIPMGLFNLVGSLQNIESAEAAGDVYPTGPSLAVNGIGTIAAALFGSCFPTTLYIGHPGWKAMGARAGYSTLNAVVMTALCLTGTVALIGAVIPMEAAIAILLWIGIIITAQAFQASPVRHAPAVAIGLFPAVAAMGATIMMGAFDEANRNPVDGSFPRTVAVADFPDVPTRPDVGTPPATADAPEPPTRQVGTTLQDLLASTATGPSDKPLPLGDNANVKGFLIHGLTVLERGFIFTCMILSAITAFLIDRRFGHAAAWALAAAALTAVGLMHAYSVTGNAVDFLPLFAPAPTDAFNYRAIPIAIGYLLMAAVFLAANLRRRDARSAHANTLEDARVTKTAAERE